ncbi:MAG: hypothetical protein ACKVLL_12990 [Verrucomicrobiales bacterium]
MSSGLILPLPVPQTTLSRRAHPECTFYLGSSIYFSKIRSAPPEMTTSITKDASEKLMITTTKKKVPFA